MSVLRHFLEGGFLIALTVTIHALGAVVILSFMGKYQPMLWRNRRPGLMVLTLSGVVFSLVFLHLVEVIVWACYYHLHGLLPDFETAAYYSLATYTTVGYGDVVLPTEWRLQGTSEALVGILMTAWSTALLIGVVNKFHDRVAERFEPYLTGARPTEPGQADRTA